ncbi:hypothetical protein J658_3751 [Acinetobacter baumannii 573719]|nr:hypothetical protein J658_3751 [Acinetobacter baumannii 573719]
MMFFDYKNKSMASVGLKITQLKKRYNMFKNSTKQMILNKKQSEIT